MNVKLLRKIEKVILEEPKRLNMNVSVSTSLLEELPICGTIGCIAGWARVLTRPEKEFKAAAERIGLNQWKTHSANAAKILKLPRCSSGRLFHTKNWPKRFFDKYYKAVRPITRARVTVARIEHFIKTKGRE